MKLSFSELKLKAIQNLEVYLKHRANNGPTANLDEMCSDTGKRFNNSCNYKNSVLF